MHCMNMNKRLLIVLALAVVLASGCDWIRAKLDMPTSEDIARKKEMIAQKEAEKVVLAQAAKADSLQVADSVSATAENVQGTSVEPSAAKPDATAAEKPSQSNNADSGLQLIPRSNLDKTYYIIVGAFKTDQLVSRSLKDNEGILEAPFAFEGNGLKYVAIGGYETLEEARKALYVAHQKSPEAWVYKKK